MEDTKDLNTGKTDRDPWADEFFKDVVNGAEEEPKASGVYGVFDPESGAPLCEDTREIPEGGEEPGNRTPEDPENADGTPKTGEGGPERGGGGKAAAFVIIAGIILLVILAIVCGFFIGRIVTKARSSVSESGSSGSSGTLLPGEIDASRAKIDKFSDVFRFISDNYYIETDPDELIEGAIAGMFRSLNDPYGHYYGPAEMEPYKDYLDGKYTGIGAALEKNGDGFFKVTAVDGGSPAEKAGIAAGDIIVKINGRDISEDALGDVESVFSKEGSEFSIVLKTPEGEKTVACRSEKLTKNPVSGRDLGNGTVYVRITQFTPEAPEYFEIALKEILNEGTEYMVLDLRDNPGGYVSAAVEVADRLLPEGVVSTARDRNGGTVETYRSDKESLGLYVAVLVNGNTASAAELVAGAVADFDAGVIIGEKTFGKALGQILRQYEDGNSGISLSAYRYYTPSGDCIDGIGITPDIEVMQAEEFKGKKISEIPAEEDLQLQKALEAIAEKKG